MAIVSIVSGSARSNDAHSTEMGAGPHAFVTNQTTGRRAGDKRAETSWPCDIGALPLRRSLRDIDVDHDWDPDGFWAGAAVGAATAAVVGSIVYSLPPSCAVYSYGGMTYQDCGGVWYAPQYQGSNVVYVVVDDPR